MSPHITANRVSIVFTDIFSHEQVRLAALRSSTSYLMSSDLHQLVQSLPLYSMLDATVVEPFSISGSFTYPSNPHRSIPDLTLGVMHCSED